MKNNVVANWLCGRLGQLKLNSCVCPKTKKTKQKSDENKQFRFQFALYQRYKSSGRLQSSSTNYRQVKKLGRIDEKENINLHYEAHI